METEKLLVEEPPYYDRLKEVKEFDDTKAGVKGLVDSGIVKIPRFFINPPEKLPKLNDDNINLELPVINLEGFEGRRRAEIVSGICEASETWGFFRIVNHGIPVAVMEEVLDRMKGFHEQPKEMKMEFYARDKAKRVQYYSTLDLHVTNVGNWKDTVACDFEDSTTSVEGFPSIFREALGKYVECVTALKDTLSELLSEALGLASDHLTRLKCFGNQKLVCHYYPPCPEPELTLGTTKHSDPNFLTILMQDNIGGLQVLHQNQWIDVTPEPGSIIINIGDLLQLITNDKFKSVKHRVVARHVGERVSLASFCYPSTKYNLKPYGPIKELLSDDNSARYREISTGEYITFCMSKGNRFANLPHFERH